MKTLAFFSTKTLTSKQQAAVKGGKSPWAGKAKSEREEKGTPAWADTGFDVYYADKYGIELPMEDDSDDTMDDTATL